MLHTGALDVGELGIQDGIGADLRGVGAEEIADVDRLVLVVRESLKDLRSGVAGDIAGLDADEFSSSTATDELIDSVFLTSFVRLSNSDCLPFMS